MPDINDELETYIFHGNEGEKVPETVEKLIVSEGVQVLPDELCDGCRRLLQVVLPNGLIKIGDLAFCLCVNLLEISIRNTVQSIGRDAFISCFKLRKVSFECSPSSPHHQLETVGTSAFGYCGSLLTIKLPSSVNSIGGSAFHDCKVLMEANLSATNVTKIPNCAFFRCSSLQTASLPKTVEWIGENTFDGCFALVTVVVPLGSQSIRIEERCFDTCRKLANLELPKDSTAKEDSFVGCALLKEVYGNESSHIVAGLMRRFENLPLHRMCYDHSGTTTTVEELRQRVGDQQAGYSLLDKFKMTPFHVLFSTIEPRVDFLDVLLDSLPNRILKFKDANGMRPLDYLIKNWTGGTTSSLLQRTLHTSMIGPLTRWGSLKWAKEMKQKAGELLFEDDEEQRARLCNEAYSLLEQYENLVATSILEMALWKSKLKSGRTTDGSKRQALDREECRCFSGSNIVIPPIASFLGIP